jgi:Ala-tRNA(Pro) deacylase
MGKHGCKHLHSMLQWQKIRKKGILMELINGRPEDCSGRLAKEVRCYDLLDSLGVPYQRIDHEAANTMEACAAVDAALGATICKNLLLCNRQCTDFYLLLIPGDKPFKTKELSKQIGSSRLSFAAPEYMEQYLDITPGSLSVLGLMNDKEQKVKLLIDADVLKGEYFGCHPCINTSSLRLKISDLMEKIIPAMGHEPTIVELETPEA